MKRASTLVSKSVNFEGPDSTYFRVDDIKPFIKNNTLHVCNYRGSHRSWGTPNCESTAYQLSASVIAVNVTGWHKHSVSPTGGTYYFVRTAQGWVNKRGNCKDVKAALAAVEVAA